MIIPLPELSSDCSKLEAPTTNLEIPYSDVQKMLSPLAFPQPLGLEDMPWPSVAGPSLAELAPCFMQGPSPNDFAEVSEEGTGYIGDDGAATPEGVRNDPAFSPFHPTSSSLFNALGDDFAAKHSRAPIDSSLLADISVAPPPPVAEPQSQSKQSTDVLSMEELAGILLQTSAAISPALLQTTSSCDPFSVGTCAPPLDIMPVFACDHLSMNPFAMPHTPPMDPPSFAPSPSFSYSSSPSSSWSLPSTPSSSDHDAWSTSEAASPPAIDAARTPRSSGAPSLQPKRKTKSSTQRKARLAAMNAPPAPPPIGHTGRFSRAVPRLHTSRNSQITGHAVVPPLSLPGGHWGCAHCAHTSPSKADMVRHAGTHYAPLTHKHVCRGVAIARDDVRAVEQRERCRETDDGTVWYGGCWGAFARAETLRRHLQTRRGLCVAGDVHAP